MTSDGDRPGEAPESGSKKSSKTRDWLIIAALVVAVAAFLYLGTMDPAERYELIGL